MVLLSFQPIINAINKQNKVLKIQNPSNSMMEEEDSIEEDNIEEEDGETEYLNENYVCFLIHEYVIINWKEIRFEISPRVKKIQIPPPKNLA